MLIPRRPSTMPIPWAVPLHDANSVNIFPAMPIPRTSIQAYRDANSARVFHDANSVDSFLHDANSVNIFLSRCQLREGHSRCQFRECFYHLGVKLPCDANPASSLVPINY